MNLTPKEVAARFRMSVGTLTNWRVKGQGPRWLKVGSKVVYPLAEVEAWEQQQLRRNTAA